MSPSFDLQVEADSRRLAELGYRQQLNRRLGLFSNFAIGFTYLSPVVGVMACLPTASRPAAPPSSGPPDRAGGPAVRRPRLHGSGLRIPHCRGHLSMVAQSGGRGYAWFAGWMYMWALLINIAAATGAATLFFAPLFDYSVTRTSTIITVVVLLAIGGVINLVGVRSLSIVSRGGVIAEILGTVLIGLIVLFTYNHHSLSSLTDTLNVQGGGSYIGAFLAASLFGVWCLYGFEACGDVAEEVVDPRARCPGQ